MAGAVNRHQSAVASNGQESCDVALRRTAHQESRVLSTNRAGIQSLGLDQITVGKSVVVRAALKWNVVADQVVKD
mgnify:CR=1 FL=1